MLQKECIHCFDALYDGLEMEPLNGLSYENDHEQALFVTWKSEEALRGCIGTFAKHPLSIGLDKYARESAFRDPRFDAISKDELQDLTCQVSLLDDYEEIGGFEEWQLGTHGIRVTWILKSNSLFSFKRHYSATFLPEVPIEQDWTREQTWKALQRKAGLPKTFSTKDYKDGFGDDKEWVVQRFTSQKGHLTHAQYLEECMNQ